MVGSAGLLKKWGALDLRSSVGDDWLKDWFYSCTTIFQ